jgi:sec-independent protein translocase protein TatC
MGIFFQLPILAWFLGKLGIVNSEFMKKYRRHAIVAILIIAAIITPTTDVFTLTIVSLPIYLLYELSILIVRRTGSNDSLPASFGRGS